MSSIYGAVLEPGRVQFEDIGAVVVVQRDWTRVAAMPYWLRCIILVVRGPTDDAFWYANFGALNVDL